MKPNRKLIIWLLLGALLLAGCRGGSTPAVTSAVQGQTDVQQTEPAVTAIVTEQVASTEPGSGEGTPYPSPTVYTPPTSQSYPQPQAQAGYTPPPFVVPTPEEGTGVVWGQMIDANTNEPMQYVYVYLGKKSPLNPGPGYTYHLQEQSSPHVQTNDKGQFAISGVKPGSYIVMIFTPRSASVVMIPDTDKELEVNVAAGDVQDLGELLAVPPSY